jgi:hypothetical protein
LLTAVFSVPASQAEDMKLRYITLFNNGGYDVDPVVLHWKTPEGEKFSKNLGAKLRKGDAICYDVKKGGKVPDGSEVWLVAKIEAGDNENCRKDRKHIYTSTSKKIWWLEMESTTLNNNRCHNVSDKNQWYVPSTTVKGNSNACD